MTDEIPVEPVIETRFTPRPIAPVASILQPRGPDRAVIIQPRLANDLAFARDRPLDLSLLTVHAPFAAGLGPRIDAARLMTAAAITICTSLAAALVIGMGGGAMASAMTAVAILRESGHRNGQSGGTGKKRQVAHEGTPFKPAERTSGGRPAFLCNRFASARIERDQSPQNEAQVNAGDFVLGPQRTSPPCVGSG